MAESTPSAPHGASSPLDAGEMTVEGLKLNIDSAGGMKVEGLTLNINGNRRPQGLFPTRPIGARPAWDSALRAYHNAREAEAAYWRDVGGPAYAEFDRQFVHVKMEFTVPARSGQSATYRPTAATLDDYCEHISLPIRTAARALRARWQKAKADEAALRARLDLDAIDDRHEALVDASYAAEKAFIATPAPDAVAFAHKLALLLEFDLHPDTLAKLRREAAKLAGVPLEGLH